MNNEKEFCMKHTNRIFGMITLIAGVMLVGAFALGLAGCDNGSGGNNNLPGSDFTSGWPSSSVLGQFGLSGLTAPAGVTDIEHLYVVGSGIAINFKNYATNDNPFHDQLISNGWTYNTGSSWTDSDGCYYVYRKGDAEAYYGWAPLTGSSIVVDLNYYDDDDDPGGPGNLLQSE